MSHAQRDFMGAKMALFVGANLLVLQRDDKPGLLWPGFWDLPGGGREGTETPLACIQRETYEEFGLGVPATQIRWARAYTNSIGRAVWFCVGHMPNADAQRIKFGDEGQGWALMPCADFLSHANVVPQFQARLRDYLSGVQPMPGL